MAFPAKIIPLSHVRETQKGLGLLGFSPLSYFKKYVRSHKSPKNDCPEPLTIYYRQNPDQQIANINKNIGYLFHKELRRRPRRNQVLTLNILAAPRAGAGAAASAMARISRSIFMDKKESKTAVDFAGNPRRTRSNTSPEPEPG